VNPAASPTLIERVARMANHLLQTICMLYVGGQQGGRIPRPLLSLVQQRMTDFPIRFARLAAAILAGTYRPRRFTPRPKATVARSWRETPLRRQGWLSDLLPGAVAAPLRGGLRAMLEDPEMKALIAAAPAPMARLLRPICWMLRHKPPPHLASARRPAGTPPPPAEPYVAPPPPPPIPGPANTPGLHPHQIAPTRPPPKRI
jgi:hypothetical protein